MILPEGIVGVDAGATLAKLVFQPAPVRGTPAREPVAQARLPSSDPEAVRAAIAAWRPARIAATGGGAAALGRVIAGVEVERVEEFAAWAAGAPRVAAAAGIELPESYLLVSVGTGTSVLAVREGTAERVGGSALGGGTLLGLGKLLVGAPGFEEIARLAHAGDRRQVDLLVGDIYSEGGIALPAELNAASFGKLASTSHADVAHALTGLIGENLALIATALARGAAVEAIVYCGSTLDLNPALEEILSQTTQAYGARPLFLPGGAFCGAVGAAALAGGEA